jgi:hypothetical protein
MTDGKSRTCRGLTLKKVHASVDNYDDKKNNEDVITVQNKSKP